MGETEKRGQIKILHRFPPSPIHRFGISMQTCTKEWLNLAEKCSIQLPEAFLEILEDDMTGVLAWKFLSTFEARKLMADLDLRYNYPGREWRGVPFARSTVSEDIVCFDLQSPPACEAKIIPIRDWNGPRWEFSGETKNFVQWLTQDAKGHLT